MTKYEDLPRDEAGDIIARDVKFPIGIDLVTPIETGGLTVSELSVREPTVGDIELANKEETGLGRMIRMITLVASLSPEQSRAMGSRDYTRTQETLEAFL